MDEVITVVVRWLEGFVDQVVITVRATPDFARVLGVVWITIPFFFWMESYLFGGKGK